MSDLEAVLANIESNLDAAYERPKRLWPKRLNEPPMIHDSLAAANSIVRISTIETTPMSNSNCRGGDPGDAKADMAEVHVNLSTR